MSSEYVQKLKNSDISTNGKKQSKENIEIDQSLFETPLLQDANVLNDDIFKRYEATKEQKEHCFIDENLFKYNPRELSEEMDNKSMVPNQDTTQQKAVASISRCFEETIYYFDSFQNLSFGIINNDSDNYSVDSLNVGSFSSQIDSRKFDRRLFYVPNVTNFSKVSLSFDKKNDQRLENKSENQSIDMVTNPRDFKNKTNTTTKEMTRNKQQEFYCDSQSKKFKGTLSFSHEN